MVRFKAIKMGIATEFTPRFNSKMVRFKDRNGGTLSVRVSVSIPKWYDLKMEQKSKNFQRLRFQFQNGTI